MAATDQVDFAARYSAAGYPGVAFYLRGWVREQVDTYVELTEDEAEDFGYEGYYEAELVDSDSMVRAVMVGDDREHIIDIDDLTKLDEDDYCHECGQLGCRHDGREREDA